jgi:hypothetical protein
MSTTSTSASNLFNNSSLDVDYESFHAVLTSTDAGLESFVGDMAYQGFDKARFSRMFAKAFGAARVVKIVVLGAMRGTNLKKIIEKSVKPDPEIKNLFTSGKLLANGAGVNDLTVGRCLACFPEVAAYYLHKHKIPKKIQDHDCPGFLQFPAAAGIPMSMTLRALHVDFCARFAVLINSEFRPEYYRFAFNGQCGLDKVPGSELRSDLGITSTAESRSVDIDKILKDRKRVSFVAEVGESSGGVPIR